MLLWLIPFFTFGIGVWIGWLSKQQRCYDVGYDHGWKDHRDHAG